MPPYSRTAARLMGLTGSGITRCASLTRQQAGKRNALGMIP